MSGLVLYLANSYSPIRRPVASILLLAALAGCASQPSQTSSGERRTEIVTESDEPEARKRARIRLELAVGYFEQGQTTIALDELKQSIAADPSYADSYNLRGLIYMRLDDYRFAEESFRKALALQPGNSNVMHNLGWLYCQGARYAEATDLFEKALSDAQYGQRAKTLMIQGLCQSRAGLQALAEASLMKSYELDPGNPVTAYNLADLLFKRKDFARAQFYIRRLNNSELANAESLWLGVKVEKQLSNREAMQQLAGQLEKRFPQSAQALAYQRGSFDE